jgi:hypothetical protein
MGLTEKRETRFMPAWMSYMEYNGQENNKCGENYIRRASQFAIIYHLHRIYY